MIKTLKTIIYHPLFLILFLSFLVLSWPFVKFPLTDADIAHWVPIAKEMSLKNNFFTAPADQSHGPLLAWGSSIFVKINAQSFYFYNFFNLLCSLLLIILTYFFSYKFWQNKSLSILNSVLISSSLVFVYLARTPMYDWVSAILFFGFGGFYYLYLTEKKTTYFYIALLFISLATMCRFSITLGLGFIFCFLANIILERRSYLLIFRDLFLVSFIPILLNLPWLIVQTKIYSTVFLNSFIYDNIGRFFIDTPAGKKPQYDFYSFSLYLIGGIWPYTFLFFITFFRKGIIKEIFKDKKSLILLSGFLPGLIVLSLSGHTKLLRYISFVFPFFIMFFGFYLSKLNFSQNLLKRINQIFLSIFTLLIIVLLALIMTFTKEAKESLIFTLSIITLLFYLQFLILIIINFKFCEFIKNAGKFYIFFSIGYLVFFSILSWQAEKLSFLISVHQIILKVLAF